VISARARNCSSAEQARSARTRCRRSLTIVVIDPQWHGIRFDGARVEMRLVRAASHSCRLELVVSRARRDRSPRFRPPRGALVSSPGALGRRARLSCGRAAPMMRDGDEWRLAIPVGAARSRSWTRWTDAYSRFAIAYVFDTESLSRSAALRADGARESPPQSIRAFRSARRWVAGAQSVFCHSMESAATSPFLRVVLRRTLRSTGSSSTNFPSSRRTAQSLAVVPLSPEFRHRSHGRHDVDDRGARTLSARF